MTVGDLKQEFHFELQRLYDKSQIEELFKIMAYEVLELNSIALRSSLLMEIQVSDTESFREILKELKTGRPYQQILGKTDFYRLEFKVNDQVLIPRPETEELIELALFELKSTSLGKTEFSLLDIGTGSGVIPIVLSKNFPLAKVHALDISKGALEVAKENSQRHKTEINFLLKDILSEDLEQSFDVIFSNPPYIGIEEQNEIDHSVKDFEPTIALFSPTSDPLIFYKRIASLVNRYLNAGGYLFLEINQKLGNQTLELYQSLLSEVKLIQDLSGNDRFIIGKK
ncbi:peptide chain release factor N(5)-glutamine methyltransferase [Chryseobacterium sp. A301]